LYYFPLLALEYFNTIHLCANCFCINLCFTPVKPFDLKNRKIFIGSLQFILEDGAEKQSINASGSMQGMAWFALSGQPELFIYEICDDREKVGETGR